MRCKTFAKEFIICFSNDFQFGQHQQFAELLVDMDIPAFGGFDKDRLRTVIHNGLEKLVQVFLFSFQLVTFRDVFGDTMEAHGLSLLEYDHGGLFHPFHIAVLAGNREFDLCFQVTFMQCIAVKMQELVLPDGVNQVDI